MDYLQIKNRTMLILADVNPKRKSDEFIYRTLLERLTVAEADAFMLSEHGGYTRAELNLIKRKTKHHARRFKLQQQIHTRPY